MKSAASTLASTAHSPSSEETSARVATNSACSTRAPGPTSEETCPLCRESMRRAAMAMAQPTACFPNPHLTMSCSILVDSKTMSRASGTREPMSARARMPQQADSSAPKETSAMSECTAPMAWRRVHSAAPSAAWSEISRAAEALVSSSALMRRATMGVRRSTISSLAPLPCTASRSMRSSMLVMVLPVAQRGSAPGRCRALARAWREVAAPCLAA
mmetsp:Transcript_68861/g.217737  ORF Transcript_68861/g.217737 Transcript_68861/m.217737 type:complete len:216 (+) Transcript_68861:863-1510(+)